MCLGSSSLYVTLVTCCFASGIPQTFAFGPDVTAVSLFVLLKVKKL